MRCHALDCNDLSREVAQVQPPLASQTRQTIICCQPQATHLQEGGLPLHLRFCLGGLLAQSRLRDWQWDADALRTAYYRITRYAMSASHPMCSDRRAANRQLLAALFCGNGMFACQVAQVRRGCQGVQDFGTVIVTACLRHLAVGDHALDALRNAITGNLQRCLCAGRRPRYCLSTRRQLTSAYGQNRVSRQSTA